MRATITVRRIHGLALALWVNPWVRGAMNSAFGLLALYFLFRAVPIDQVEHHLEPRHLSPLLAIVVLTLLSQVARATRWMLLLRAWTRVRLTDALWVNAATQLVNYALPFRAGEALRLWWLVKRGGQSTAVGLGVIVVDHAFDLGGVAAVLSAGTLLKLTAADTALPSLAQLVAVLGMALAALGAIGGGLVFGPRLLCSGRVSRFLPRRWVESLRRQSTAFRIGLAATRGQRLLGIVLASATAMLLDGLAFFMLFPALGLAVPVASAIVTQVTLLYTYVLPAAPGYVGSLEAMGTFLLSSIGLSRPVAAGAIVLWHLVGAAVVIGLGLVALYGLRRSRPASHPVKLDTAGDR
ncbi:MAG TPA: lysylphosphatidylglycerol synthase transmembrane domain-containing protein [Candidatus Dormibacteraeota bacterium]|nr:lysylphosphatidylglycerol synthase transmembrane domain-containing protein [Candidatus Dormibacteraeota bacterium]